jgi:AraC-like DNA-binding protein
MSSRATSDLPGAEARAATGALRRATSAEDFCAAPVGAYVTGRVFLFFYPHEELSGYSAWGNPSGEDFDAVSPVRSTALARERKPHPTLLDFRWLEGIQPSCFERAIAYAASHREGLARNVTRLALLRATGVTGAIVAGFYAMIQRFCPVRVFTEPEPALIWLGRGVDISLFAKIDALRNEVVASAPIVNELRALLDRDPRATLVRIASEFRMTERSLQRRLGEAGTSLRDELNLAKVRAAEIRLATTDASLTEIAYDVGCSSAQHFSTLFRKVAGETPSAWRARHRGVTASGDRSCAAESKARTTSGS